MNTREEMMKDMTRMFQGAVKEAYEDLLAKAVAEEREACAKVCEEVMQRYKTDTALAPDLNKVGAMSAELCALWIRKRGEK